ncbi:MAG TPA: ABC transporter substrate-binding protein [Candidatus Scybalocola faecigallinarum]|uniref:ABC transporter substrate-binding protein n=1 Tax=Candidatus Scybalocola faecigallinarum TaxID=2840941 RepID=A0A9D1F393_9FIRM|nr:ABC transporter substrate-binding protein [Candidatus Scybalocola faecigallinarum]
MKSKRLLALLLASAMTASAMLAGCGGNDSSSGSGAGGGNTSGASGSSEAAEGGESSDGYSTEIDMEEEPYTVAIQVVTLPGTDYSAGLANREAAINAIIEPAINCNIDIQEVWISEIANTTSMAVAGDEKVDIIHVGTVNALSSLVGSDILLDLNEGNLLQNRGPKLMELFSETMEAGSVGGRQLAVPAQVYSANYNGIIYNKTWADEHGIEVPEEMTFEEFSDLLYQVHETDPDIMPFYTGSGSLGYLPFFYGYESFGSEASYGAVLNSDEGLTVENLYASDLFRDYCLQAFHWTQDGIQPGDPTDTNTAQDYLNSQALFCTPGGVGPKEQVSFGSAAASAGFEIGVSRMTETRETNATVTQYMWGIAVNCERPDKAMDLLNYIYTDANVANILLYGLEGENYEFAEGSDRVIVANGTYEPGFLIVGDESQMLIKSPAGEDYIDQLQALKDSATVSPLVGYMFDDTNFQTESSVIYSTIQEYLPRLQNGMCDSEQATLDLIDEFVARLDAAGINEVIAANQEQLDAYLAEQE